MIYVILICLFFGVQEEVPLHIQEKFTDEYPNATNVSWEVDGENFEVDYEDDGGSYEMLLDQSGMIISISQDIPSEVLPVQALKYLIKNFDDLETKAMQKVSTEAEYYFEVELIADGKEIELTFDDRGNLTSREEEDADED